MSAITPSEEETAALALLAELQLSPSTQPQSVFAALKRIKHELIGHDQKKELFVRLGVVPPLVRILAERRGGPDEQQWSDLRVEAGIAVGSLAYGGEPYIYQLFNSNALPPLIASLNASSSPKLILSSLRTLNTILDTYTSSVSSTPNPSFTISSVLYTPEVLRDLHKILAQESSSTLVQQQISLTANLIAKSCGRYPPSSIDGGGSLQDGEGAHQRLLVEAGVLEALSARLSSFVFTGNTVKHCRNIKDNLIPPPSAKLAPILDALSAIIKDSKLRSLDFLFSPPISSIFPHFPSSPAPEKRTFSSTKPSETALAGTKITLPQPKVSTSLIQPPQLLITPSSFPPLSAASATSSSSTHFRDLFPLSPPSPFSFNPTTNPSQYHYHPHHHHHGSHHTHTGSTEAQSGSNGSRAVAESDSESSGASPLRHHYPDTVESEDAILHSTTLPSSHGGAASTPETEMEIEQSRLVLWLITKVRGGDSVTRLMAIGLLTNIFRVGLIRKKLVLLLVLLVLPVLVRLLDNLDDPKESGGRVASAGSGGVIDAEMRKRWTISERAPAVLAQLVMDSVDMQKAAVDAGAIKKLANLLKKSAESFPSSSNTTNGGQNAKSLPTPEGTNGVGSPAWQHCMRVKEGTLRCLASLALFKDEYRKAIIDAGVVPILVSSMKPINPVSPDDGGSPSPVLIAACGLIRALSRSVSILRTSLIDAGVATPLFALLTNDDIEVRNASTAAVCNLVLEFSPMRGPILEAGVLEILCGHAKSSHAGLRLNALWALKHLVLEADIDVKKKCFEGLGGDWLIGVIRRDVESIGKDDEDEPMAETPADDDDNEEMENTKRRYDDEFYDAPEPPNPRTSTLPPKAARLYAALEIAENDSASRIKKQETALQEQGLDFLRNLICGKGCHMMIKTLFSAFSSATLFSVLSSLLSPSSNQPPGEVVNAVVYILIHLAAGSPDQKTLLIEQTPLLKKLCQYWNHRLPNVRTGLAWIVINLTWREDGEEDEAVRERGRVLRELGFAEILQKMKADAELDVRERVKTACYQMGE